MIDSVVTVSHKIIPMYGLLLCHWSREWCDAILPFPCFGIVESDRSALGLEDTQPQRKLERSVACQYGCLKIKTSFSSHLGQ